MRGLNRCWIYNSIRSYIENSFLSLQWIFNYIKIGFFRINNSISIIIIILLIWNFLFNCVCICWNSWSKTQFKIYPLITTMNSSLRSNKIEIPTWRNVKPNSTHWSVSYIKLILIILFNVNIWVSCKCSTIRREFKIDIWRSKWYYLNQLLISTIIIKYSIEIYLCYSSKCLIVIPCKYCFLCTWIIWYNLGINSSSTSSMINWKCISKIIYRNSSTIKMIKCCSRFLCPSNS